MVVRKIARLKNYIASTSNVAWVGFVKSWLDSETALLSCRLVPENREALQLGGRVVVVVVKTECMDWICSRCLLVGFGAFGVWCLERMVVL